MHEMPSDAKRCETRYVRPTASSDEWHVSVIKRCTPEHAVPAGVARWHDERDALSLCERAYSVDCARGRGSLVRERGEHVLAILQLGLKRRE